MVYFRFYFVFEAFIQESYDPYLQFGVGIVAIILGAIPYIRLFVGGKEDKDIQMGTSNLTQSLTVVRAISVLFYVIGLPIIVQILVG